MNRTERMNIYYKGYLLDWCTQKGMDSLIMTVCMLESLKTLLSLQLDALVSN